ncbi:phage tail assembly protein T [Microbulbifer sp. HZ11]|uniref:phage tail assembly protein T n=1 Tax=Microbulbifer sp. HZ11 TaxID=1453501 RepID=UPI0005BE63DE|nr:phage tail assembly protein T [Microbulbifer sp. HZ11]
MPGFIFARQLARDFNRPDYFNMLRSMSSTELDHWYSYHREKPLHGDAIQLQLAQIAAGTCGGKVSDYIPEYRQPKSINDQIAIWKSMA